MRIEHTKGIAKALNVNWESNSSDMLVDKAISRINSLQRVSIEYLEEMLRLESKLAYAEEVNISLSKQLADAKITEYVTKKEFEEYKVSLNKEQEGEIHKMFELPKEDADYDSFSVDVEALTQGGNWVEGYFCLREGEFWNKGNFWVDDKGWTKPNLYQGWRYLKD